MLSCMTRFRSRSAAHGVGTAYHNRDGVDRLPDVVELGLMSAVDTMYAVALLIVVAIVAGAYQYRR
jgi:hypothetical protein